MNINKASQIIEEIIPSQLAEEYDNVGLLVGTPDQNLTGILIALDITQEVMQEAITKNLNMIITHHPIWFRARKNLINNDFVSRKVKFAIQNELNLYACHTNLDNLQTGVNQAIVDKLGLHSVKFLDIKPSLGAESNIPAGSGMIGVLPEKISEFDFLSILKNTFQCKSIRYRSGPEFIQKIAVCGGAGDFLLEKAMELNADAFLTGEVGYHRFFDVDQKLLLADLGHYESEQYTVQVIYNLIQEPMKNVPIQISNTMQNPVQYFL